MTVTFFHECSPPTATAQQRRHTRTGKTYQPASVGKAAAIYRAILERYKPPEPLTGPLAVKVLWTWPGERSWKTTRPDLDNLAKLILDAATMAGYWKDDAQIASLELAKFTGDMPGISFTAETIERRETAF